MRYILTIIALILISIIYAGYFNYATSKEITFEILSYEEVPEFVKDKLNETGMTEASTLRIDGTEGPYLVIVPPEDESVEILYVGKDETMGYGFMYKYTYIKEASMDVFDNIRIIKINHYNGGVRGVFIGN